ncbi:hypothetical protein LINPERPRIM_LOCUS20145 [Linum perenne]
MIGHLTQRMKDTNDQVLALARQNAENITTINARLDQLEVRPNRPVGGGLPRRGREEGRHPGSPIKIDFPQFFGDEDPTAWICRANGYFEFHRTADGDKVLIALIYLEGEAQLWQQIMKEGNQRVTWEQLVEGMYSRFGPKQFQDPFGELTKLSQSRIVRDYQSQFEKLLVRGGKLSNQQQVSCFISGLEPRIRIDVQAAQQGTLIEAIGLARLFEEKVRLNQGLESHVRPPQQGRRQIKRLTPSEMKERRDKGLCFNCDD